MRRRRRVLEASGAPRRFATARAACAASERHRDGGDQDDAGGNHQDLDAIEAWTVRIFPADNLSKHRSTPDPTNVNWPKSLNKSRNKSPDKPR